MRKHLRALAWILITIVLGYASFYVWSFVWANFFESHIAFTAGALAVYLTLLTLLIGGASFFEFVRPVLHASGKETRKEDD